MVVLVFRTVVVAQSRVGAHRLSASRLTSPAALWVSTEKNETHPGACASVRAAVTSLAGSFLSFLFTHGTPLPRPQLDEEPSGGASTSASPVACPPACDSYEGLLSDMLCMHPGMERLVGGQQGQGPQQGQGGRGAGAAGGAAAAAAAGADVSAAHNAAVAAALRDSRVQVGGGERGRGMQGALLGPTRGPDGWGALRAVGSCRALPRRGDCVAVLL